MSEELWTRSKLLVHFDPRLEIVLACDASSLWCKGCVGTPVARWIGKAYVSRVLSKIEKLHRTGTRWVSVYVLSNRLPYVSVFSLQYVGRGWPETCDHLSLSQRKKKK